MCLSNQLIELVILKCLCCGLLCFIIILFCHSFTSQNHEFYPHFRLIIYDFQILDSEHKDQVYGCFKIPYLWSSEQEFFCSVTTTFFSLKFLNIFVTNFNELTTYILLFTIVKLTQQDENSLNIMKYVNMKINVTIFHPFLVIRII